VKTSLARRNPRASICEAAPGGRFAGAELLLATSSARAAARAAAEEPPTAQSHLDEDAIESFAWKSAVRIDRRAFESALAGLPPQVLRAKGFLHEDEGPTWLFQYVCGRVELSVLEGPAIGGSGARGVFIGTGIRSQRERIVALLERAAQPDEDQVPGLPAAQIAT
jgi:G3E family GTPase